MAEPSSTALAAATAITTGTLTLAGSFYGIPADSMLAATLGAGMAMASAQRIEMTRASIFAAVSVFVGAMVFAVFFGPLVGLIADALVYKFIGVDLPDAPTRAAVSLLIALGAQRWLPVLLDRVTVEIKGSKP